MVNRNQVIDYLQTGAQAANLRHKVIANNLAHLDVPGFRRGQVKFETLLQNQLETGRPLEAGDVPPEVYQPRTRP